MPLPTFYRAPYTEDDGCTPAADPLPTDRAFRAVGRSHSAHTRPGSAATFAYYRAQWAADAAADPEYYGQTPYAGDGE